ncbi:MAG: hypothetical protein U0I48_03860 [Acutalibacteraceae bacterium]|nr:hypothetical protein [Acutalibacteraceae bacterium]
MSRELTPEERKAYEQRRREQMEDSAKKLGLTVEELENLEKNARTAHHTPDEKERASEALRKAIEKVGTIAEVDEGNVDGMSEEEFSNLLAARMSILDEEERREASKAIARKIACWRGGEDNPLSLREEILIELQAMIRRHEYYSSR